MAASSLPSRLAAGTAIGLLTLAGLVAATPARAQDLGRLFVFGDSSADVGSDGARYTNRGEMWAETLARRLGRTAKPARAIPLDAIGGYDRAAPVSRLSGDNYAVGGATAAAWTGTDIIGPSVSFADQVGFFRQDHPAGFASNDVVMVWMGGNDAANALLSGVAHDSARYAQAYMAQISALRQAGARDIIAFNEPAALLPVRYYQDILGLEPDEIAAVMEVHSSRIAADNQTLRPRLAQEGVYVLDLDRLTRDVLSRPDHYGFTATTDSYMTLGDPRDLPDDGNVFADSHYSAAMQAVIADFAQTQMEARNRFATLATDPLERRRLADAALAPRLEGPQAWMTPIGSVSLTASADLSRRDTRTRDLAPGQRRDIAGAGLGAHWRAGPSVVLGVQADLAKTEASAAGDRGGRQTRDLSATVYGLVQPLSGLTLSLAVTGGQADHDEIERRTRLGGRAIAKARGETQALYGSVRLGAAYGLEAGDGWTLTPAVAVTGTRVRTDGYQEASGPIALHYGKATVNELRAGGSVTFADTHPDHAWRPRLTAGFEHVVDGDAVTVLVGPTADQLAHFRSERPARTWAHAAAGLDVSLSPEARLGLSIGADRAMGKGVDQKIQPHAQLALTLTF